MAAKAPSEDDVEVEATEGHDTTWSCDTHAEPISSYCTEHSMAFCDQCDTKDHCQEPCKLDNIKDVILEMRRMLDDKMQEIEKLKNRLKTHYDSKTDSFAALANEHLQSVNNEVTATYKDNLKSVKDKEQGDIRSINKEADEEIRIINEKREKKIKTCNEKVKQQRQIIKDTEEKLLADSKTTEEEDLRGKIQHAIGIMTDAMSCRVERIKQDEKTLVNKAPEVIASLDESLSANDNFQSVNDKVTAPYEDKLKSVKDAEQAEIPSINEEAEAVEQIQIFTEKSEEQIHQEEIPLINNEAEAEADESLDANDNLQSVNDEVIAPYEDKFKSVKDKEQEEIPLINDEAGADESLGANDNLRSVIDEVTATKVDELKNVIDEEQEEIPSINVEAEQVEEIQIVSEKSEEQIHQEEIPSINEEAEADESLGANDNLQSVNDEVTATKEIELKSVTDKEQEEIPSINEEAKANADKLIINEKSEEKIKPCNEEAEQQQLIIIDAKAKLMADTETVVEKTEDLKGKVQHAIGTMRDNKGCKIERIKQDDKTLVNKSPEEIVSLESLSANGHLQSVNDEVTVAYEDKLKNMKDKEQEKIPSINEEAKKDEDIRIFSEKSKEQIQQEEGPFINDEEEADESLGANDNLQSVIDEVTDPYEDKFKSVKDKEHEEIPLINEEAKANVEKLIINVKSEEKINPCNEEAEHLQLIINDAKAKLMADTETVVKKTEALKGEVQHAIGTMTDNKVCKSIKQDDKTLVNKAPEEIVSLESSSTNGHLQSVYDKDTAPFEDSVKNMKNKEEEKIPSINEEAEADEDLRIFSEKSEEQIQQEIPLINHKAEAGESLGANDNLQSVNDEVTATYEDKLKSVKDKEQEEILSINEEADEEIRIINEKREQQIKTCNEEAKQQRQIIKDTEEKLLADSKTIDVTFVKKTEDLRGKIQHAIGTMTDAMGCKIERIKQDEKTLVNKAPEIIASLGESLSTNDNFQSVNDKVTAPYEDKLKSVKDAEQEEIPSINEEAEAVEEIQIVSEKSEEQIQQEEIPLIIDEEGADESLRANDNLQSVINEVTAAKENELKNVKDKEQKEIPSINQEAEAVEEIQIVSEKSEEQIQISINEEAEADESLGANDNLQSVNDEVTSPYEDKLKSVKDKEQEEIPLLNEEAKAAVEKLIINEKSEEETKPCNEEAKQQQLIINDAKAKFMADTETVVKKTEDLQGKVQHAICTMTDNKGCKIERIEQDDKTFVDKAPEEVVSLESLSANGHLQPINDEVTAPYEDKIKNMKDKEQEEIPLINEEDKANEEKRIINEKSEEKIKACNEDVAAFLQLIQCNVQSIQTVKFVKGVWGGKHYGRIDGCIEKCEFIKSIDIPSFVNEPLVRGLISDDEICLRDSSVRDLNMYVTNLRSEQTEKVMNGDKDMYITSCAPIDSNLIVCGKWRKDYKGDSLHECITLYDRQWKAIRDIAIPRNESIHTEVYVDVDRDGMILAAQRGQSNIYVINPANGKRVNTITMQDKMVTCGGIQALISGDIVLKTVWKDFTAISRSGEKKGPITWDGSWCCVDKLTDTLYITYRDGERIIYADNQVSRDGQIKSKKIVGYVKSDRSSCISQWLVTPSGNLIACAGDKLLVYKKIVNV